MKRLLFVVGMVFVISWTCVAQTDADSPATKEDIEKYLQTVHSRGMAAKMADAMAQGLRQMLHEQYLKHKDELPADYESKMAVRMDEMFANMPWDEMMQATVPIYQKHFTKGDIDNLIVFYSTPTGEKILREMPSIATEAMRSMMPIVSKYVETVQKRLLKETDVMIAQSKKASDATTPASHN
ncbi:MAG: DUF2059 domain-containing protein [Terriglobales bacterium]|jgi:hypothetical protein